MELIENALVVFCGLPLFGAIIVLATYPIGGLLVDPKIGGLQKYGISLVFGWVSWITIFGHL